MLFLKYHDDLEQGRQRLGVVTQLPGLGDVGRYFVVLA
jgi:hypothetical protein